MKENKKDEKAFLDLVACMGNLKAIMFGLETKDRRSIRVMIKNTLAAISATNSIVGSMLVIELLKLLENSERDLFNNSVFQDESHDDFFFPAHILLNSPNESCVCRFKFFQANIDFSQVTSGHLAQKIDSFMQSFPEKESFVGKYSLQTSNLVNPWSAEYIYSPSWPEKIKKRPIKLILRTFSIPNKEHLFVVPGESKVFFFLKNEPTNSSEISFKHVTEK